MSKRSKLPPDAVRCRYQVMRDGQLLATTCARRRKKGYLWCWQHVDEAARNEQPGS